jgi:hypothetical protein
MKMKSAYQLTVQAIDSGGLTNNKTFTVKVLNVSSTLFLPRFDREPFSQIAAVGGTVSFIGEFSGTVPMTNQWRKCGVPFGEPIVLRETNRTTITIRDLKLSDACEYDLVISNLGGSLTSSPASLQVTLPIEPDTQLHITKGSDGSRWHRVPILQGVTLTTDRFGQPNSAYAFHGDSVITVPNIDPDDYAQGFSFGFWIRPLNGIGSPAYWNQDANGGSTYFTLQGHLRLGTGSAATVYENVGNLNIGQWQHVLVTHDSNFDRLYLSGAKVFESATRPLFGNASTLMIGGNGFQGDIDEFTVVGRGLDEKEAFAVFAGILNEVAPESLRRNLERGGATNRRIARSCYDLCRRGRPLHDHHHRN